MRQLYLAATGMNRGKTTVSLGLLSGLFERRHTTGFIKPVGQRYAVVDGIPADRDWVLVEGTGHAGVGSVVDLSNAQVARMLGAPVLIVSEAGVGRPIDEIVLNRALFERE